MKLSEIKVAAFIFIGLGLLPLLVDGYPIYILPEYMIYGILAMSLGLLWGFVGIVSFGQAAFFLLGGYTLGWMMQSGITSFNPGYLALIVSIVAGGAIALVVGLFFFSANVRDSYFVVVTLALTVIAENAAISQSDITGGFNGMYVPGMSLTLGGWKVLLRSNNFVMYYFVFILAVGAYAALRWATQHRFGKILVGIRENEDRMVSLGYRTALYKAIAFAASGALASFAGALYAAHAGFISPSVGGLLFTTEIVTWVAIAGRSSLLAAFLGAIVISYISNYLSGLIPEYWQLVLGLIFIIVIAFFSGGVAGALSRLQLLKFNRHGAEEENNGRVVVY